MIVRYLGLKPEAKVELEKVDTYDFNIFNLRAHTDGNELTTILPFTLARHGLIGSCHLDFNALMNFLRKLQDGYKAITYHNSTHAADVCQTFNYFSIDGGMKETLQMNNLEQMSCLLSACLHDFEHPGVNNLFLVNMNDKKAVMHNDVSVLENHHLAASF